MAGFIVAQQTSSVTTYFPLGMYSGTQYGGVAQNFTCSVSCYITQAFAIANVYSGSPSGSMTASIQTNNPSGYNHPSGTILASGIFGGEFAYFSPILLTAGTMYWLVLSCSPQAANTYWGVYAGANVYGGELQWLISGVGWYQEPSYNMYFYVYSQGTNPTPTIGGPQIVCLSDGSDHGGTITTSNQDGTVTIGSGLIPAVNGAQHNCPITYPYAHGNTPIIARTTISKINGKLILTQGALAGCGASMIPPDRKIYVET